MSRPVRLLIVAPGQGEITAAAAIAYDDGAEVSVCDSIEAGLAELRTHGADLALVDVSLEIGEFIQRAKAERMALPVLGCGVDAPADRAVAAIRAGARDYVPLPPDRALIAAAISTIVEEPRSDLIGDDRALRRAVDLCLSVADSAAPVLIHGEAGTGKATLARAVHVQSGRAGRFVTVDCGGNPDVVQSELFGHEAGAFETAQELRVGGLEKAAGGTLLLSNIEALSNETQVWLAQVLRSKVQRRLGGTAVIAVDARMIATTRTDLDAAVGAGQFPADLRAIFRLVTAKLPPLAERGDDVDRLARAFVRHYCEQDGRPDAVLSPEACALLSAYAWPGNVRELEDVIHRAVLLAGSSRIDTDALVLADGTPLQDRPQDAQITGEPVTHLVGRTVGDVERALILETLERCKGNRTSASNILGISVRTMRNKLRTFAEAGIPVHPAG